METKADGELKESCSLRQLRKWTYDAVAAFACCISLAFCLA